MLPLLSEVFIPVFFILENIFQRPADSLLQNYAVLPGNSVLSQIWH